MKKILGLVVAIIICVSLVIGDPMAYFGAGGIFGSRAAAKYATGYYKVTADDGLNLRSGAKISYSVILTVPTAATVKVRKVKKKWGYTTYNGRKGWISLKYTSYLGTYLPGKYKITAEPYLRLRKSASTGSDVLINIPKNTAVKVSKSKGVWGYTTYKGKKGWIMMKYVKMQSVSETAGPELSIKNMKANMLSRTSVKMSWSRLGKAGGYKVYRSSKKSKGYSLIATTKKNYIKDSKLGKNKYYYYKVRAYRGSNKKAYGNITGAQEIYTGSAPTSFTSLKSEGDTSIKIKWEKAVYSNGYEIYMCGGSKYVRLTVRKPNTSVAYTINGLKEGTTYYYKIRTFRTIKKKTYYSAFSAVKKKKLVRLNSKITGSGITKPKTLKVAQAFTIKGKVKSTYKLKNVKVGICASNGSWKSGSGMTASKNPKEKSFDIKSVDADILFDNLSKGKYYYKVTAKDTKGYAKTVVKNKFKVTAAKFIWPCGNRSNISCGYGWRILFGRRDFHPALDIAKPIGTAIRASRAGTVNVVQNNPNVSSYGKYIIVEHGSGYATLYAHCSKIVAYTGKKVKQGEVIAKVGSTGCSTGPHVHFEIRYNSIKQNPLNYLP